MMNLFKTTILSKGIRHLESSLDLVIGTPAMASLQSFRLEHISHPSYDSLKKWVTRSMCRYRIVLFMLKYVNTILV
jgi:hypothetical protein